ncbi:MAG: SMI1/KNR4 family protein [Thermoguttaceae bacterium]|nr:SMI1/KNR4 family protein [Thermoguttaceae bacterium]
MLNSTLERLLETVVNLSHNDGGVEIFEFEKGAPATDAEIERVENELQRPIPQTFKNVSTTFAKELSLGLEPSDESQEFFGELGWSLDGLPELVAEFENFRNDVYPDADDPYARAWQNKFPLYRFGNEDYLAVDVASQEVVYLSHDGDTELNGLALGRDFEDFAKRSLCLAASVEYLQFVDEGTPYLNVDGANACALRKSLGWDAASNGE